MVIVVEALEREAHQRGYTVTYDRRENFFRVEDVVDEELVMAVHIIFVTDRVDLIWTVVRNGEVRLGSSWTVYSRLLIDPKYRIKMPAFKNYDELEGILEESFEMYEEFKAILIKEYLG
ncbi:hypothetical protein [Oceanobacillus sp. CFH 90083]|uniref:hypothetical protein n=1 Tax=Oceanobacillus sp. CFH 90083 TaxID=2592336 RepID=UPI00128C3A5C|nr:hypothetical protein [Oceanobacillus sp. CFH 90083]